MLMLVFKIPLPVDPDHLKKEYQLCATSALRVSRKLKEDMKVWVSSCDPQPLIFGTSISEDDCFGTQLL